MRVASHARDAKTQHMARRRKSKASRRYYSSPAIRRTLYGHTQRTAPQTMEWKAALLSILHRQSQPITSGSYCRVITTTTTTRTGPLLRLPSLPTSATIRKLKVIIMVVNILKITVLSMILYALLALQTKQRQLLRSTKPSKQMHSWLGERQYAGYHSFTSLAKMILSHSLSRFLLFLFLLFSSRTYYSSPCYIL